MGEVKEEEEVLTLYEIEKLFDMYQMHDYDHNAWLLEREKARPTPIPEDDDDQDEFEMTDEQYAIYDSQIEASDGFYVEAIPGVCEFGQIVPVELSFKKEGDNCVSFCEKAIDEFNNKAFKDTEGQLEFDKLLMATDKWVNGVMYYLTFDAKNLAKQGQSITYQAVVLYKPDSVEVLSFRKKPSGSEKKWFWVGHLCGGCQDT